VLQVDGYNGYDKLALNRPGIFGGSNSQVNWSHDEQDNEQIQS
jgi:hypothetical protein